MPSSPTCCRRSRAGRPSCTPVPSPTSPTATAPSSPTGWRWPPRTSSSRRPASGRTWVPRSSSTSSAAPRAWRRTRRSWWPPCARSRCTAAWDAIVAGKPLDPALLEEDPEAVRAGGENLAAQIELVRQYGVPVVVATNVFPGDAPSEFEAIREVALAAGARDAVVTTHWADGGAGAEALAAAVWEAASASRPSSGCSIPTSCRCIEKIETIATRVYGADGVDLASGRGQGPGRVRPPGLQPPAGVHGQDAPLDVARPQPAGAAEGLPRAYPRGAPGGWRGLHLPARRRHAHHARAALAIPPARTSTSTSTAGPSACSVSAVGPPAFARTPRRRRRPHGHGPGTCWPTRWCGAARCRRRRPGAGGWRPPLRTA